MVELALQQLALKNRIRGERFEWKTSEWTKAKSNKRELAKIRLSNSARIGFPELWLYLACLLHWHFHYL